MRHLDTHVVWLQEAQARRMLPLHKVDGRENQADFGTKNLSSDKIEYFVKMMNMAYRVGRAKAAAQLHALEKRLDSWDSRGSNGRWVRNHRAWRKTMLTPNKVSRGPAKNVSLSSKRITVGEFHSGRKFMIKDDWCDEKEAQDDEGAMERKDNIL